MTNKISFVEHLLVIPSIFLNKIRPGGINVIMRKKRFTKPVISRKNAQTGKIQKNGEEYHEDSKLKSPNIHDNRMIPEKNKDKIKHPMT